MGAKDTFPSRLLSLTEANEVEPLFFSFFKWMTAVLFLGKQQTTWCDPSAFLVKIKKTKGNTASYVRNKETLMTPIFFFFFERLSEGAHRLSEGVRETGEEGQISYFECMHVMNKYVFHVNCAHMAYCNGLGQTLHFSGHACPHVTNRRRERQGEWMQGDLKLQRDSGKHFVHLQNVHSIPLNVISESKKTKDAVNAMERQRLWEEIKKWGQIWGSYDDVYTYSATKSP